MGRGMGAMQANHMRSGGGGRGVTRRGSQNFSVYQNPDSLRPRSTHSDRTKLSQDYGKPPVYDTRADHPAYSYKPSDAERQAFYDANPGTDPNSNTGNWLRDVVRDNPVRDTLGSAPGAVGTGLENTYDYLTGIPAAEVTYSILGGTLFEDTANMFGKLLNAPKAIYEWWQSDENYLRPENLSKISDVYGRDLTIDQQRQALEAFTSQMPGGDDLLKSIDAIQSGQYGGGSGYQGPSRRATDPRTGRAYTDEDGNPTGSTRIRKPGDPGYVDYSDPRKMGQAQQYQYFQQLKGMGEDINMSDEEWENASDAERQANLEDRQAFRELHGEDLNILQGYMRSYNPMTYGTDADGDPIYAEGSISGYNLDSLSPFDDDFGSPERLADVETKFLNGEISETQLNRYLDDVERSTGNTFNVPLSESLDMLEGAGFTDRELQEFSVDYTTIDPNTGDYRSDEEYFDYFESVVNQLEFEDPELEVEAYDMYDTRRAEDYANAFDYLDAVAGTDTFSEVFSTMDAEKTNAYLDYLKDQGRLEESVYREMVAANLSTDDQKFFYLQDGSIATNESGSIYDDYRIVQFDDLGEEYDSPSSIEGFTDEQNERRATIAMLDAGNVSFSDVQKGMKKPEKKKWYDDPLGVLSNAAESWFFGGTKELGPAIENVLKGEANSRDWLKVTPFALEMAEVITPGVSQDKAQDLGEVARADALANGATAADAVQAGKDAYDIARKGKGFVFGDLYTMGYNESKAAINAALTDNLDEFAQQRITAVAFEKGMDAVGDTDLVKSMSPRVREATQRTLVDLANGRSLEESLKDQAEDYGEEVIRDWAKEHDWGQYEDKLKQMGRDFDDAVLQPLKEMIPDGGQARKFLSDFDDEVVQKFTKPIGDLGSDIDDNIIQPGRDFVEDNVIDPIDDAIDSVGDVVDDVIDTVGDALPEFPDGPDLPDFDLPDFDLPDFDFPDIPDFGRFLSVLGPLAGMPGYASPEEEKDEDDLMQFAEPYDFSGDSIFRDRAQEKRFGITRDSDTLLADINGDINDINLDEFAEFEGLDGIPQLSRFRGF